MVVVVITIIITVPTALAFHDNDVLKFPNIAFAIHCFFGF